MSKLTASTQTAHHHEDSAVMLVQTASVCPSCKCSMAINSADKPIPVMQHSSCSSLAGVRTAPTASHHSHNLVTNQPTTQRGCPKSRQKVSIWGRGTIFSSTNWSSWGNSKRFRHVQDPKVQSFLKIPAHSYKHTAWQLQGIDLHFKAGEAHLWHSWERPQDELKNRTQPKAAKPLTASSVSSCKNPQHFQHKTNKVAPSQTGPITAQALGD